MPFAGDISEFGNPDEHTVGILAVEGENRWFINRNRPDRALFEPTKTKEGIPTLKPTGGWLSGGGELDEAMQRLARKVDTEPQLLYMLAKERAASQVSGGKALLVVDRNVCTDCLTISANSEATGNLITAMEYAKLDELTIKALERDVSGKMTEAGTVIIIQIAKQNGKYIVTTPRR